MRVTFGASLAGNVSSSSRSNWRSSLRFMISSAVLVFFDILTSYAGRILPLKGAILQRHMEASWTKSIVLRNAVPHRQSSINYGFNG